MDNTTKMMEKMGEGLIEGLEEPEGFSEMEQMDRKLGLRPNAMSAALTPPTARRNPQYEGFLFVMTL